MVIACIFLIPIIAIVAGTVISKIVGFKRQKKELRQDFLAHVRSLSEREQ